MSGFVGILHELLLEFAASMLAAGLLDDALQFAKLPFIGIRHRSSPSLGLGCFDPDGFNIEARVALGFALFAVGRAVISCAALDANWPNHFRERAIAGQNRCFSD